jgi:hypothetical protein
MKRKILYWVSLIFIIVLPTIVFICLMEEGYFNPECGSGPLDTKKVHPLIPNTTWDEVVSCSYYFNESEEFAKAISCANQLWMIPLRTSMELPKCYVITHKSKDISSSNNQNYVIFPPNLPYPLAIKIFGVYQPETKTIFIVDNPDVKDIYRHELQHYFLHKKYPWTCGMGHDQEIWKVCEPPYHSFKSNFVLYLTDMLY